MAGIGAESAYGNAAGYQGLQDWMRGRRQQVVQGQQDADRVREQGIQDQELEVARQELLRQHTRQDTADQHAGLTFQQGQDDRTAGIAADAQHAQQQDELIQQVRAMGLPKMAQIGAEITIRKGGQLPPQLLEMLQPKGPKIQFAPNGRAVDMNDPSIVGQNFAPPRVAAEKSDPVVQVKTMENGRVVTKFLPQSQVVGKTFESPSTGAGPTLTAPMRKALVDAGVARKLLTQLGGLFEGDDKNADPTKRFAGAKALIGPLAGPARGFGQSTGLSVDPTFAEFKAATARLKNATIQAITGAAMGVDEAKRIIDEIPTESDDPRVWPIKYKQALANLDYVEQAIHAQAGGETGAGPAGTVNAHSGANTGTLSGADPAGADTEYDWTPNGLVPRKT